MEQNLNVNYADRDVFDNDDIVFTPESTAGDGEEWDSSSHISFIVGMEKGFGLKFTISELQGLKNIGELVMAIDAKLEG